MRYVQVMLDRAWFLFAAAGVMRLWFLKGVFITVQRIVISIENALLKVMKTTLRIRIGARRLTRKEMVHV